MVEVVLRSHLRFHLLLFLVYLSNALLLQRDDQLHTCRDELAILDAPVFVHVRLHSALALSLRLRRSFGRGAGAHLRVQQLDMVH